ncbi:MAG TPA: hypothetical protein VFV67_23345 [Actinophytocola sp.]|uniref:hypothetical protein n=1 Tax=Actinophytocola sp. TaxID=1872138 RepID=UPI002DBCD781|nr:hypothetical protein [Actinophytocola sp.]HEU5473593.1 hypothetical protein [Actinophytocola sp.]
MAMFALGLGIVQTVNQANLVAVRRAPLAGPRSRSTTRWLAPYVAVLYAPIGEEARSSVSW